MEVLSISNENDFETNDVTQRQMIGRWP